MPIFDEYDARLAQWRECEFNLAREAHGPRHGDFLLLTNVEGDDVWLRFTHDWGDEIQTTCLSSCGGGIIRDASYHGGFYLHGPNASFSGSLDPSIAKDRIERTDQWRNASFWFFHHNLAGAGRGVWFTMPVAVYKLKEVV